VLAATETSEEVVHRDVTVLTASMARDTSLKILERIGEEPVLCRKGSTIVSQELDSPVHCIESLCFILYTYENATALPCLVTLCNTTRPERSESTKHSIPRSAIFYLFLRNPDQDVGLKNLG
jgi:hypothetical protein